MDGTQIPIAMSLKDAISRYNTLCKDRADLVAVREKLGSCSVKGETRVTLTLTIEEIMTLRTSITFALRHVDNELEQKFYVQREDENG